MKQQTKKVFVPASESRPSPMSSEMGRKEKVNGIRYRVSQIIINRLTLIRPDNLMVECNDGWFNIYAGSDKLWFRVGPTYVEKNKEFLQKINQ